MALYTYFIFGLTFGAIVAQELVEGSGNGIETVTSDVERALLDVDTEKEDDFVFGSGDHDYTVVITQEGSGVTKVETKQTTTSEPWKIIPMPRGVTCESDGSCFCTDTSGNKVLSTKVFKQYPECKPIITDITRILPSRHKPVEDTRLEVTHFETTPEIEFLAPQEDKMDTDIYIVERSTNPPIVKERSSMSNKIPTNPPLSKYDEKKEEDSNIVASHQKGTDVNRKPIKDTTITHPGILAAIIAGGVVLLLCIVLLIMFIVYRIKKKDEGSYPLDISKQTPMYAKVPDKEYFA